MGLGACLSSAALTSSSLAHHGPQRRVPGDSLPWSGEQSTCRARRRGVPAHAVKQWLAVPAETQAERRQSQALLLATEAAREGSSCFQRPLQSGDCSSASTGL